MPKPIQSCLIVDSAEFTHLIYCLECPSWREVRPTRAAALLEGARHLQLTHRDPYAGRKVKYLATRPSRSAASPSPSPSPSEPPESAEAVADAPPPREKTLTKTNTNNRYGVYHTPPRTTLVEGEEWTKHQGQHVKVIHTTSGVRG